MGAECIVCCQCTLAPQLQVPEPPPSYLEPQFETSLASKCLVKDRPGCSFSDGKKHIQHLCLPLRSRGLRISAVLLLMSIISMQVGGTTPSTPSDQDRGEPLVQRDINRLLHEDSAFDLSMFDDIKASLPVKDVVLSGSSQLKRKLSDHWIQTATSPTRRRSAKTCLFKCPWVGSRH